MLSQAIKQRFLSPQRVATEQRLQQLEADTEGKVLTVRVGSLAQGAVVKLFLGYQQSTIARVMFQTYGSPTLIALTDAFCEQLEQRSIQDLPAVQLASLQQELSIPNTEYHTVLLLTECLEKIKDYFTQRAAGGLAPQLATK